MLFGPKPEPVVVEDPLRADIRKAVHDAKNLAQRAESVKYLQERSSNRIIALAKETTRKIEDARKGLRCDD